MRVARHRPLPGPRLRQHVGRDQDHRLGPHAAREPERRRETGEQKAAAPLREPDAAAGQGGPRRRFQERVPLVRQDHARTVRRGVRLHGPDAVLPGPGRLRSEPEKPRPVDRALRPVGAEARRPLRPRRGRGRDHRVVAHGRDPSSPLAAAPGPERHDDVHA